MLATTFWPPLNAHAYLPARPSPLSPRSANACPRPQFFSRMADAKSTRHDSPLDYSKRMSKPNPLFKSKEDQRAQRRGLFLKKVGEAREDKRWEGRSDQVLRSDYLSDRRQWEHERRRSADLYSADIETENDLPMFTQGSPGGLTNIHGQQSDTIMSSNPEDEVEVIAHLEEEELHALVALADDDYQPSHPPSERYGSDEEDWESLFMECVNSNNFEELQRPGLDAELIDEMEIG